MPSNTINKPRLIILSLLALSSVLFLGFTIFNFRRLPTQPQNQAKITANYSGPANPCGDNYVPAIKRGHIAVTFKEEANYQDVENLINSLGLSVKNNGSEFDDYLFTYYTETEVPPGTILKFINIFKSNPNIITAGPAINGSQNMSPEEYKDEAKLAANFSGKISKAEIYSFFEQNGLQLRNYLNQRSKYIAVPANEEEKFVEILNSSSLIEKAEVDKEFCGIIY